MKRFPFMVFPNKSIMSDRPSLRWSSDFCWWIHSYCFSWRLLQDTRPRRATSPEKKVNIYPQLEAYWLSSRPRMDSLASYLRNRRQTGLTLWWVYSNRTPALIKLNAGLTRDDTMWDFTTDFLLLAPQHSYTLPKCICEPILHLVAGDRAAKWSVVMSLEWKHQDLAWLEGISVSRQIHQRAIVSGRLLPLNRRLRCPRWGTRSNRGLKFQVKTNSTLCNQTLNHSLAHVIKLERAVRDWTKW